MDNDLTPPDGEMVDASNFWAQRNQPANESGGDSQNPEHEVVYNSSGRMTVERAPSGWISFNGGDLPKSLNFKRLLVANRGEIARRIFRTARSLGVETVAVFSEPDRSAAHVRDADIAVALGGTTSTESYLDTAKILDAAKRVGADAIHPGYGFLSENPNFAEAVESAGLTWVGPTPASIRSMALKVEAKRIASAAGVPLVPGAELAHDVTSDELEKAANAVGYPVLVKASAGGGGKGMRVVNAPEELADAVETARREALNSFGDATVFFERYLTGARHVEVQVFGDTQGNAVHLFERECSIQRRHQKIVEESPSPGATRAVLDRMYDCAIALTQQIGYVGAGTVEFLVFGEGAQQEFFFLEMNTRLQVEHPVTEAITGLDLVELQLRVASGEPLPIQQSDVTRQGHAIEVRLYAEDAANNYLPSTGRLSAFGSAPLASPESRYARVDSGFERGDDVSPFYDPMLAKIISHEDDRQSAAAALVNQLRNFQIAGVTTNRDSLIAILESDSFVSGKTPTNFLDIHSGLLTASILDDAICDEFVLAAAIVDQFQAGHNAAWRGLAFNGWSNTSGVPQRSDWSYDKSGDAISVAAIFVPTSATSGQIELRESCAASGFAGPVQGLHYRLFSAGPPSESTGDDQPWIVQRIELDGISREFAVENAAGLTWVSNGRDCLTLRRSPRFVDPDVAASAGGPAAPVPGTVVSVEVAVGDEVVEGQTLVVLEAMKMEHRITADTAGTVTEVHVTPGASVDAHQVLVTLE